MKNKVYADHQETWRGGFDETGPYRFIDLHTKSPVFELPGKG